MRRSMAMDGGIQMARVARVAGAAGCTSRGRVADVEGAGCTVVQMYVSTARPFRTSVPPDLLLVAPDWVADLV